jgi:1,5-anhydro-D-fructose reductase (1,5-anhydro-D-mannitol-forming)
MAELGWGIIGCGDITDKRGAPAINAQPDSRLVAFHSRTASQAESFALKHNAQRWTTSREDLIRDPEIDAVYVATEHHRHCDDVIASADAGKHVLCEKPMANSVADCRRMIDACRANGVALQIAYYRRYYPKMMRMRELLDSGSIGTPVSASIHLATRVDPAQVASREGPGAHGWRLRPEISGGGALVDTGSHRLDLLCYLLGEPELVAAFADRAELPEGSPDMESLLIRMASGVHVVTRHGLRTGSPDEFEIVGTAGVLSATPVDGPTLKLHNAEGQRTWDLPKHENVHYPLLDDFTKRVLCGQPPQFTGEDGLQATRIIEAAYRSAQSREMIEA